MMGHHTDSRAAGSPYWAIHCARLGLGQVTDGPSRIEDFKFESCNDWLRMTPRVARLITAATSDFKLSVAGACYYNVTGTCPNCVGGAGPETADYKPTIYRYNICCYVSHLRHYIPHYITWQESPTVTAPRQRPRRAICLNGMDSREPGASGLGSRLPAGLLELFETACWTFGSPISCAACAGPNGERLLP